MPLIQVKVLEGIFSEAQKEEMIRKFTDAMVSIAGENMRAVTVVVVEEVKSGSWGIAGKALTTSAVKALAAGESPPESNPAPQPAAAPGRKRKGE